MAQQDSGRLIRIVGAWRFRDDHVIASLDGDDLVGLKIDRWQRMVDEENNEFLYCGLAHVRYLTVAEATKHHNEVTVSLLSMSGTKGPIGSLRLLIS